MSLRAVNEEVLYATDAIVRVGRRDIASLKRAALRNPRKRVRLCAHADIGDRVHEMLIVHARDTYVRPHKHLDKSESFHLIEGRADVVVFEDDGRVSEVVPMGDHTSDLPFYYRMSAPRFHTLLIRSEVVVFHETTAGPFDRADTVFAPWAPDGRDADAAERFMKRLSEPAVR